MAHEPIADAIVSRATERDIRDLAVLFDAYRQFYEQPADLALAEQFLAERMAKDESIVFIARDHDGAALGFTQLYPSFSSARARRILILNDLFVTAEGRRKGVGEALIAAAAQYGRDVGAAKLSLATALTNLPGQALYAKTGWLQDTAFLHYNLAL